MHTIPYASDDNGIVLTHFAQILIRMVVLEIILLQTIL